MRKIFFTTILTLVIAFSSMNFVSAQGMLGNNMMGGNGIAAQSDDGHTASGETEGKAIWRKLQTQELNCEDVSDEDFHALGMYFMGLMVGDSHEAMDTMMEQMMGEEGEDQMHIAMGKRMSGCEPNAPMPQSMMDGGMMQMMMNIMTGGWSSPFSNNTTNNMMNFGFGHLGSFSWIFMILWWILFIAGIIALIKWLTSQSRGSRESGKSALEILKERYAKSEIDKKEFEEKKKDLVTISK